MDQQERNRRWATGESYDRYIQSEFASFRKEAWKKQITEHFQGRQNLEILDVGTGPGFFACILAQAGHRVTAIDSSEGMLACARANAERLGVAPVFRKMDVNAMAFPPARFDVIVSRNVTWTLEHPEQVYRAFRDLLKPDGMLLIYDANWHLHFFDEQARERVLAREQRHFETYGVREVVSGGDMAYYETAPLTRIRRPAWDRKTLEGLGFSVCITEDIGRWLYEQWEKDLYGESPLFEICAMKSASDAIRENMHTYWQQRAASFGFGEATVRRLMDQVRPCLPEGQLDVLDVGTGTGVVAAAMARLGHRVTAADLCGNMLEKAKENLTAMGLTARYVCAAAGKLPFAENSFDVIISRNVTWALPEPEQTLGLWQKLLRPGGRLIYWDGNHYYYLFNETDAENRQRLQALAGTVHGENGYDDRGNPLPVDYSLCDQTAVDLPLSRLDRPWQWDNLRLPEMGFAILTEQVYRPQTLLDQGAAAGFYTSFFLAAVNKKQKNSAEAGEENEDFTKVL
ncbi:MAG: class I SAM-dependent methyltransferase [Oscillospiraceae bacterium]|jgi:2-polyprenyl-3-methyl-5-hydroxy-6-metoxy-1,4-benzoquinol methylase|nr:class I SAM-dependent methyltransferase [Oscillospiraceae bacterium]